MTELKKHTIVDLAIESIAFGGKAIAHINGFTIFVESGLPGQKVRAKISRKKDSYAEARIVEIISRSPVETNPPCPYFGICGGCRFQNLEYNEQLSQKRSQVKESLEHIGGFRDVLVHPTVASPEIFYYRNKMEFSFARQRWLTREEIQSGEVIKSDLALGLHVPKHFEKVLDIDQCLLLSERSNQILNFVTEFTRESGIAPYSTTDHSGFWRFLVIRESKHLDHFMINFVTADYPDGADIMQSLADQLIKKFPFITTVVHNINRKKAQIAFGDEERIIYGAGYIEELLGERKYRISANSFFQTNTLQAENLYQFIVDWAQFNHQQIVYDLYSGTGGIAIFLAKMVKQVIGFELVPQAIEDAKINCRINSIDNCHFIPGDLKDNLADPGEIIDRFGQPSVVIIDPPRSGLHPKLPEKILELRPEKIIYVSCNPATLARDLKLLCQDKFGIISAQPVDMFPHTAHCEVVVLLERKR